MLDSESLYSVDELTSLSGTAEVLPVSINRALLTFSSHRRCTSFGSGYLGVLSPILKYDSVSRVSQSRK